MKTSRCFWGRHGSVWPIRGDVGLPNQAAWMYGHGSKRCLPKVAVITAEVLRATMSPPPTQARPQRAAGPAWVLSQYVCNWNQLNPPIPRRDTPKHTMWPFVLPVMDFMTPKTPLVCACPELRRKLKHPAQLHMGRFERQGKGGSV